MLGTEFEISAYDDALTEVIVRSGRVEIRSSQEMNTPAKVLTPGDHARFNIGGEITVESGVDADALLAWTEGRLAFHGEHFAQVVPELERWFDLEIQLEDESLAERRLTAVFTDEPLDVVLETLGALIGATVERDGKRVTFTPAR